MRGPPKRKSPARGCDLLPGCDLNLVRGIDQSRTYAEAGEIATAAADAATATRQICAYVGGLGA